MIEVRLTNITEEECLTVQWPAVPRKGDLVQIGPRGYRVTEVVWHPGTPHVVVWIEEIT